MTDLEQLKLWVKGKPKHNYVTGQCVPDTSCCLGLSYLVSEFERYRFLKLYRNNDIDGMDEMMCGFNTGLFLDDTDDFGWRD